MQKIISNKAKCLNCDTVLESKFRHDFNSCPCGDLAVDGGRAYIKRLFKDPSGFEELSEFEEESK